MQHMQHDMNYNRRCMICTAHKLYRHCMGSTDVVMGLEARRVRRKVVLAHLLHTPGTWISTTPGHVRSTPRSDLGLETRYQCLRNIQSAICDAHIPRNSTAREGQHLISLDSHPSWPYRILVNIMGSIMLRNEGIVAAPVVLGHKSLEIYPCYCFWKPQLEVISQPRIPSPKGYPSMVPTKNSRSDVPRGTTMTVGA